MQRKKKDNTKREDVEKKVRMTIEEKEKNREGRRKYNKRQRGKGIK